MDNSNNGFLKLDNSIIDYWMSRLNHSEFKTLLAIYRKTVGWNKIYDKISQSQLAITTGLTTRSIRTAITSLEKLGVIITAGSNKTTKVFSLNTNKLYDVCLKSDDIIEIESKLESFSKDKEENDSDSDFIALDYDVNCLHKRHYEDTNKKQIKNLPVKTEINISFETFWEVYDYNKGKKSEVKVKWESMTDEERQSTIDALPKYKDSTKDKTYRKYPMSFLNMEAWNDEMVSNTTSKDISASNNQYNANTANNNSYSAAYKEFSTVETPTNSASEVHWSELKSMGMFSNKQNPTAIAPNSKASKDIDEWLSTLVSKGNKNKAA